MSQTENLCPQQMLRVRATVVSATTLVSATMCPQQYVLVCQGLYNIRVQPETSPVTTYDQTTPDGRLLETVKVVSKRKSGDRAFEVTAPSLWNTLPPDIRDGTSINKFKKLLKTFFFNYLPNCQATVPFIYLALEYVQKYLCIISVMRAGQENP